MSNIELIDLTKHYRQGKNLVRAVGRRVAQDSQR